MALRTLVLGVVLLAVVPGAATSALASPSMTTDGGAVGPADAGHLVAVGSADVAAAGNLEGQVFAQVADDAEEADDEDEEGEEEDDEDEDEEGVGVLGDWWGLGEEAAEAPYVGLVELGVLLLVVGVVGYSVGKRTSVVPPTYRRRLLQAHEWTVLAGTALVVPHFLAVEEWEGLGLLVGVLLVAEVVSGLYGRHLHRHVVRMGRGTESASLLGSALDVSKSWVFARWRRVHVLLTLATALVLVAHVLAATGGD